ncbi:hypothetical protein BH09VER1_BH09VER1_41310 [soil metagenome]
MVMGKLIGRLFLAIVVSTVMGIPSARAVITLTTSGTYIQNFDTLPSTAGTTTFVDDSTLAGWFYVRSAGTGQNLIADNGSSTTGGLHDYGATSSTDRSLGALASGSTGTIFFGVEFLNNSGSAITFDLLSYLGEQWRAGSVNVNVLSFSYLTSSSPIVMSAGSWNPVTQLDFSSPNNTGSGTLPTPATTSLSQNLNVTVNAGDYIMFRWQKIDNTGADDGLAVDDLNIAYSVAAPVTSSIWTGTSGSGGDGLWTQTGGTNWSGTAWNSNSKAIFGGTPGTVTVSGTVSAANGAEFDVSGYNISGGEIAMTGTSASANTFTATSGVTASIGSVLSGSNGFTKAGNGTIALSGSNTFSGTVSVTGGLLQIADDSNLGAAANSIVMGGGGLKTVSNVSLNAARQISGVGIFDVANSTTLTINGGVNMTVTTISNTGTLNLQGSTRNVGSLNFNAAGSLTGSGTITATGLTATNLTSGVATVTAPLDLGTSNITVDVGGGGTVALNGLTFGGTTTNYITKTGSGILDVAAGGNAISRWRIGSGTTDGGTLQIHDSAGAGTNQMFFNYGTLYAASDLTGANAIAIGLSIGGRSATQAILAGSNMQFNGDTALFESAGVATILTVNNTSIFNGTITQSATAGTGFVVKGSGVAVFNGTASALTRATSVTDTATLVINGSWGSSVLVDSDAKFKGSGTIAGLVDVYGLYNVGNAVGTQTAQAGVTMRNGSTFQWDLKGNTSLATDADQLIVSGGDITIESGVTLALNFSGTGSTVDWSNSFWDSDHTWTIADMTGAGSLTGLFAMSDPSTWLDSNSVLLSTLRSQAEFTVGASGSDVVLTYSAIPEPSTIALLFAGGLGLLLWQKARRRATV